MDKHTQSLLQRSNELKNNKITKFIVTMLTKVDKIKCSTQVDTGHKGKIVRVI